MTNSFKKILKLIFISHLIFILNSVVLLEANAITEEDIENSEEYFQKKATYRELKSDKKLIHEISIEGLVISDLQLTQLIGESQLTQNIQKQQWDQRLLFGGLTGGGLLIGSGLLAYANANRQPISILQPQTTQFSGIYINGQRFDGNTPAFIAGIIGSLFTILGLVSALQLIYELTGLNQNSLLDNKVAKELVDKYNKQLKARIKANYMK